MRYKRELLAIMAILMHPLCIYASSLFDSRLFSRDTLYAWADGGLNMRMSGSISAEIIGSIPYGRSMLFIEYDSSGSTEQVQFYKADKKDDIVNGVEIKCLDYFQRGWWIKVQFDKMVGYVFSGYTSRYVPIKNDFWIPNWINENVKLILENEVYDQNSDGIDKFQYFDHGISVLARLTNSGHWTYIIPNMTLEEAMLLTRKQIEANMKDVLPNRKGCINEMIGDQESGTVTYKITNNANWAMAITWTYNAVIISESFWC
jgi:hypothetical protein